MKVKHIALQTLLYFKDVTFSIGQVADIAFCFGSPIVFHANWFFTDVLTDVGTFVDYIYM